MMEAGDREVLKIMVDGGLQVCDHALTQWEAGAYGSDENMRQENLTRWNNIKARIRPLAAELKRAMEV